MKGLVDLGFETNYNINIRYHLFCSRSWTHDNAYFVLNGLWLLLKLNVCVLHFSNKGVPNFIQFFFVTLQHDLVETVAVDKKISSEIGLVE